MCIYCMTRIPAQVKGERMGKKSCCPFLRQQNCTQGEMRCIKYRPEKREPPLQLYSHGFFFFLLSSFPLPGTLAVSICTYQLRSIKGLRHALMRLHSRESTWSFCLISPVHYLFTFCLKVCQYNIDRLYMRNSSILPSPPLFLSYHFLLHSFPQSRAKK